MASLTVEKGNTKDIGKKFSIGENAVIIGRQAKNNKPDIALHDDFISRRHVEIVYEQDCYKIRDLQSLNGTVLDDTQVRPGEYYRLEDNCVIGLGIGRQGPRVVFRFRESLTDSTIRISGVSMVEANTLDWIMVDENKRKIWVDNHELSLTKKEYDLLVFLYKRAGTICDKDEIINKVWSEVIDPGGVSNAAVDQLVHRLRIKIEHDPTHPIHLISKKGFGYILQ